MMNVVHWISSQMAKMESGRPSPEARRRSVHPATSLGVLLVCILPVACRTAEPIAKLEQWSRLKREAQSAMELGDAERARSRFEEALVTARQISVTAESRKRMFEAWSHQDLAVYFSRVRDSAGAARHLAAEIEIYEEMFGAESAWIFEASGLPAALVSSGEVDQGYTLMERLTTLAGRAARPVLAQVGPSVWTFQAKPVTANRIASMWTSIGVALHDRGDVDAALDLFERSLELLDRETNGHDIEVASALGYYARSLEAAGRSREAEEARARMHALLAGSHYAAATLRSSFHEDLARWLANRPVLTILVEPPEIADSQRASELEAMARQAVERWQTFLQGGGRRIEFMAMDERPDIYLGWQETRTEHRKGLTNRIPKDPRAPMEALDITIFLDDRGSGQDDEVIRTTLLHELGHAVGIWGHSPYPGDLMYCCWEGALLRGELTERDRTTLARLDHAAERYAGYSATRILEDVEAGGSAPGWRPASSGWTEVDPQGDRARLADQRFRRVGLGGWEQVPPEEVEAGPAESEQWYTFPQLRNELVDSRLFARTEGGGWQRITGSTRSGPEVGSRWYSYEEMEALRDEAVAP